MIGLRSALIVVVIAAAPLTDSRDKARCHSACVDCRVRSKQRSKDPGVCIETCLELKRQCCASCGAGPGPRTTCSCT